MNWAKIEKDMRKIRAENEVSIVLRRAGAALTAQSMRVEITGTRGFQVQSDAAREARQAVVVLGEKDMDIKREDRFTINGLVYRVVFIQPNRQACTLAEAVLVE